MNRCHILCLMGLLTAQLLAAQNPPSKAIPRNWLALDPGEDSIAGVSLKKAYGLLAGRASTTVIVAVIDNGVDIAHEDLKKNIWTNSKEIPGNGIDDDHNGYIDDVHGWSFRGSKDGTVIENELSASTQIVAQWEKRFARTEYAALNEEEKKQWRIYNKAKNDVERKKQSTDSLETKFTYNLNYHSEKLIAGDAAGSNARNYGSPVWKLSPNLSHGTHVAGIIAAEQNNGIGIDGIADHVLIMPLLATTAGGDERDKDVAAAIRYAVDNGARIINMSFSKLYSTDKKMVDAAIRYAEEKNVLIVHAAGNDGVDIDSSDNYHYPIAIYENEERASNFITVGWSRPLFDYRLAHPYGDYGKQNVDLYAPGSDIWSTVPGNGYDFKSGSSMAAPVVTGVAALLLSYFPLIKPVEIKNILMQSSFKPDQMVNKPQTKTPVAFNTLSVSGGIVNAYNAVKMAIGKK